jgi:hypothetical protein
MVVVVVFLGTALFKPHDRCGSIASTGRYLARAFEFILSSYPEAAQLFRGSLKIPDF